MKRRQSPENMGAKKGAEEVTIELKGGQDFKIDGWIRVIEVTIKMGTRAGKLDWGKRDWWEFVEKAIIACWTWRRWGKVGGRQKEFSKSDWGDCQKDDKRDWRKTIERAEMTCGRKGGDKERAWQRKWLAIRRKGSLASERVKSRTRLFSKDCNRRLL